MLCHEKRRAALGTWLLQGLVPYGKRTGRIFRAAEKYFSLLRSFLTKFSGTCVFRTLYSEAERHGIFTFGITGASHKLAKPALLNNHVFSALAA
jgi:hypothetical protein